MLRATTTTLTCDVPIVFLQLMRLHPLVAALLIDVDFMVIGANGNLCREDKAQEILFLFGIKKKLRMQEPAKSVGS